MFSTVGERLSILGGGVQLSRDCQCGCVHIANLYFRALPTCSPLFVLDPVEQQSEVKRQNHESGSQRWHSSSVDSSRLPRPIAAIISIRTVSLCLGDTETSERQTNRNTYDKLNMMAQGKTRLIDIYI